MPEAERLSCSGSGVRSDRDLADVRRPTQIPFALIVRVGGESL